MSLDTKAKHEPLLFPIVKKITIHNVKNCKILIHLLLYNKIRWCGILRIKKFAHHTKIEAQKEQAYEGFNHEYLYVAFLSRPGLR